LTKKKLKKTRKKKKMFCLCSISGAGGQDFVWIAEDENLKVGATMLRSGGVWRVDSIIDRLSEEAMHNPD